MVHRLDMSTSGVMVIALNIKSYRNLQKQFLRKTIKKLYVAVLERDISNEVALEGKLIYRLGGFG
jgi:tRNA pseudouridine32 synthase/23S rRNA pseudouridine746 synthase